MSYKLGFRNDFTRKKAENTFCRTCHTKLILELILLRKVYFGNLSTFFLGEAARPRLHLYPPILTHTRVGWVNGLGGLVLV